jgi:hypothetical protein
LVNQWDRVQRLFHKAEKLDPAETGRQPFSGTSEKRFPDEKPDENQVVREGKQPWWLLEPADGSGKGNFATEAHESEKAQGSQPIRASSGISQFQGNRRGATEHLSRGESVTRPEPCEKVSSLHAWQGGPETGQQVRCEQDSPGVALPFVSGL